MVKTCCVKNCDIGPEGNVICFRFPNSRLQRRKWIDAIGLSSKLCGNSTVCIRHFTRADYDYVRGRPRLRARVVPSVFGDADERSLSSCISEDDIVQNEIDTDITLSSLRKDSLRVPQHSIDLTDDSRTVPDNDSPIDIEDDGSKDVQNDGRVETKYEDRIDVECKSGEETKNEGNSDTKNEGSSKPQNDSSANVESKDRVETQNEGSEDVSTDVNNEGRKESQNADSENLNDNDKTEVNDNNGNKESHDEEKNKSPIADEGSSHNENEVKKDVTVNSEVLNDGRTDSPKEGRTKSQDGAKKKLEKDTGRSKSENGDVEVVGRSRRSKANGIISKRRAVKTGYQESFIASATATAATGDLVNDIEDIIVNYHIKQTRPPRAASEPRLVDDVAGSGGGHETDPVFIELAVQGAGDRAGDRDCLMVLESVQVELDPSSFLHDPPDGAPEDIVDLDDDRSDDRRQDPISLLTSSDEDEVIIQEPHIDTVEVSDETDEDDVPLVKLLNKPKKKKKSKVAIWNQYEYFCSACQFTASSSEEYKAHTVKHSTILQVCEICDYTTASKSQFSRHKRKHKDDKKFKCHLCEYKARHNMSLIYHLLKSHRALTSVKKGFKCDKCGFISDVKTLVLKHVKMCTSDVKMYSCNKCLYETKRPSDLRRHKLRRHKNGSSDDEECVP